MKRLTRLAVAGSLAFGAAACEAGILAPDPLPTGVIESVDLERNGSVLLRNVEHARPGSLVLALPAESEIYLVSSPGRLRNGSYADLRPGVRIQFQARDLVLLSSPPILSAIWIRVESR